VCLTGWQLPGATAPAGGARYEAIWCVDPAVVREAARVCAQIASERRPALAAQLRERLDAPPTAPAADQLRLATAITNRTLASLDASARHGGSRTGV
jgi:MerR family transcriptional regulator, light-induced transcriptional regulator